MAVRFLTLTLLLLSGAMLTAADGRSTETTPTDPPKLPRPDHRALVDSGLLALYDMTHFFLEDMVHLGRYLTWMEEKKGVDLYDRDAFVDSFDDDGYWDWVEYWIGFTICVTVGCIAIIAMPIIGISVACCRCCGRCGGKSDPEAGKNTTCKMIGCGIALTCITCFLLAGTVLMFVLNDVLRLRMQGDETLFDDISDNLRNIDKYLQTTVSDLDHTMLGGYIEVKEEVFETLDNIPMDALNAIDEETGVVTAFQELDAFVEVGLRGMQDSLTMADQYQGELVNITEELEAEIDRERQSILDSIGACSTDVCNEARTNVENLGLEANYSIIVVTNSLEAIKRAFENDIEDHVQAIENSLVSIANEVNHTMFESTVEVKQAANDIEKEIEQFVVDVNDTLDQLDFDSATEAMDDAKDAVDQPWDIVYWSIVGLASIVCVIILCNVVGVVLGSFLPRPPDDTVGDLHCACNRSQGADWLLAGIGLTFVFYWWFMVVVVIMFAVGGISHVDVCRNFVEYETPESRSVMAYYDSWINDTVYEETDGDISLSYMDLYEDCQRNLSFYNALDLANKGYDLDEILDLTPLEEALEDLKEAGENIDIGTVNVYPEALEDIIEELDRTFQEELDFEAFYAELEKPVTTYDLNQLADDLLALQGESGVEDDGLEASADFLQDLHTSHVQPAEDVALKLDQELKYAEGNLSAYMSLSEINKTLSEGNEAINEEGNEILHNFVDETADDIFVDIESFVEEIDYWVRYELGNCWPMYESLTAMVDSTCVTTLYPINGFWYSLGICVFFLIPSICVAYALVNEYRRIYPYGDRGNASEIDNLYDPFKAESNQPLSQEVQEVQELQEMLDTKETAMEGVDNPIFIADDYRIPRPSLTVVAAEAGGYPASSYPAPGAYPLPGYTTNQYPANAPPPSYNDSVSRSHFTSNTKL